MDYFWLKSNSKRNPLLFEQSNSNDELSYRSADFYIMTENSSCPASEHHPDLGAEACVKILESGIPFRYVPIAQKIEFYYHIQIT